MPLTPEQRAETEGFVLDVLNELGSMQPDLARRIWESITGSDEPWQPQNEEEARSFIAVIHKVGPERLAKACEVLNVKF